MITIKPFHCVPLRNKVFNGGTEGGRGRGGREGGAGLHGFRHQPVASAVFDGFLLIRFILYGVACLLALMLCITGLFKIIRTSYTMHTTDINFHSLKPQPVCLSWWTHTISIIVFIMQFEHRVSLRLCSTYYGIIEFLQYCVDDQWRTDRGVSVGFHFCTNIFEMVKCGNNKCFFVG